MQKNIGGLTMGMPAYKKGKYDLLDPGKYIFRILEKPILEERGQAIMIILKFTAISEKTNEAIESSCIMWPWEKAYEKLIGEIVQSSNEADYVGKSFRGEIVVRPNPKNPEKDYQSIKSIEPLESKVEREPGDDTPPPGLEEEGPEPEDYPSGDKEDEELPF